MCFLVQKLVGKNVQNRHKNGWKNVTSSPRINLGGFRGVDYVILGEMLLLAEVMYGGQTPAAFAH